MFLKMFFQFQVSNYETEQFFSSNWTYQIFEKNKNLGVKNKDKISCVIKGCATTSFQKNT